MRGDCDLEAKRSEFSAHDVEVGFQGEIAIRGQQREVQVFRIPGQAVKDAQARAAVERGLVEEAAALQAGQRDFLHHLPQCVFAVLAGIACQHLFDHGHRAASTQFSRARSCAVLTPHCA